MALSNWDLLAFDTDGKSCNGVLEADNLIVRLYKNWLYVERSKDDEFSVNIQHGEVKIGNLNINAVRHEGQQSVFVFVEYCKYEKDKEPERKMMAGIGCYGFQEEIDWVKKTHPEEYAKLPKEFLGEDFPFVWSRYPDNKWGLGVYTDNGEISYDLSHIARPSLGDLWIGVQQETSDAFFTWLRKALGIGNKYCLEHYTVFFDGISKNTALRVNQGDLYFAENLNIDPQATPIGKSEDPLINYLLNPPASKDKND